MKFKNWLSIALFVVPSIGYSTTFECISIDPKSRPEAYILVINQSKDKASIEPRVDLGSDSHLTFISETPTILSYKDKAGKDEDFKFLSFLTLNKKTGLLTITSTIRVTDEVKRNSEYQFKQEAVSTKLVKILDRQYQCK